MVLACAVPNAECGCSSSLDCSLNGVCEPSNSSCSCDPGWAGPSCGVLALAPAPPGGLYGFGEPFATTSWGGNAIFDASDARWHLFVTEVLQIVTPDPSPFPFRPPGG